MIRWGIIGCGDVTEVKSGPGFQHAANSALVAVMRRDAGKAADFARRHNVPRWYANAGELLADPNVDAVSIATPPSSHAVLALQAAAARKPTLVEKPMAISHAQCSRMIDAFRAAGVPLFVAYYRRALPKFVKVKELLESGAIGRPIAVQVTHCTQPARYAPHSLPWRFQPETSGGGLFVDLGAHTLDLLDFYFGPITDVWGRADRFGENYTVEDAVVMAFRHQSGMQGVARWHFTADRHVDRVEIEGTEGTILFPTFGAEPVMLQRRGHSESFDLRHPPAIQQPLIQSVVDELEGRGKCPSTGESAARTTWVMEQVLRPYYERKH